MIVKHTEFFSCIRYVDWKGHILFFYHESYSFENGKAMRIAMVNIMKVRVDDNWTYDDITTSWACKSLSIVTLWE